MNENSIKERNERKEKDKQHDVFLYRKSLYRQKKTNRKPHYEPEKQFTTPITPQTGKLERTVSRLSHNQYKDCVKEENIPQILKKYKKIEKIRVYR